MKQDLVFSNTRVHPGSRELIPFRVADLADGTPVTLPLIVINGNSEGPCLWMGAILHGPEMAAYEVIRRVARDLVDPGKLRGSLVAVPILNPLAFRAAQMHTPEDGYNLNRLFPGRQDGFLGEQMADTIMRELIAPCDYVIDFHANPHPAMAFTLRFAGSTTAHERTQALATAFGLTEIEMRLANEQHRTGTITEACLYQGKAALAVELIGWRRISDESTAIGVRGTLNVMRSLGMVDGVQEPQVDTKVIPGALSRVEVNMHRGGIVEFLQSPGDQVTAGTVIALIRNGFGDVQEEVRSPLDGFILAYPLISNQASTNGEAVAFIAYYI